MLPNEKSKVTDTSKATAIEYSRAYTFLDSYIYMRNGKYNALYQKNKEILSMEKEAIEKENAEALYAAATEQMLALNSVIVRIRDFAQECRRDVIRNLQLILPDGNELSDFDEALSSMSNIPKLKVLKYQILPITYPNMAVFLGLFRKELLEFIAIDDETSALNNPFPHNVATKFLIDTTEKYANSDVGILGKESMEIANKQELIRIKNYFHRKQNIINIVIKDFRTFYVYLRQYKALDQINDMMKPTVMIDGSVKIGSVGTVKTFHDYLTIYKHYSMMIKYLMDTISNFDSKFFNKIYAIQSNIECYRSIMNNVITIYKTRMRNVDESFNDIAGTIGGPEIAVKFLNDEADPSEVSDRIEGLDIKDSVSDEYDFFEDTYDKNPDVDSIYNEYKEKEISGKIDNDYHDPRKYLGGMNPLDRAEDSLAMVYDNVKPTDLQFKKQDVLKEATDAKKSYKEILENILENIISSNDKFKNSAAEIHKQYGDIHEKCKDIDIQSYDLSGVEFSMYNFPKGVDYMDHIRIPSFRESDAQLLLTDNGIEYKRKYFEKLYYFNQNECPINMTRFRGSLAQKSIQEYDPAKMFAWFIEYIETYDKVINAISHANARIKAAINRGISLFDLAYGGDNNQLTEAILINRSQFKNDVFKILLEADGDVSQPDQEPAGQQPEELNINDKTAQVANDANALYKAIIQYVKITNEINAARMLMYETILSSSFEYLKIIRDSITNGSTEERMDVEIPEEEAPAETAPANNQSTDQSQPNPDQNQEQQPQPINQQ